MFRSDILQALSAVEVEYWYEVDHNWGRQAQDFYADDGEFAIGDRVMLGRAAIAEFYRWREARGTRTARHLVSNFRLASCEASHATLECVLCLHAADGVPILESRPAIMIADVISACIMSGKTWRYTSHRLVPIFMGGAAPTIPPT